MKLNMFSYLPTHALLLGVITALASVASGAQATYSSIFGENFEWSLEGELGREIEEVRILLDSELYEEALRRSEALAAKDNAHALYLLGFIYESGSGVEPSGEKAVSYYTHAHKSGYAKAGLRKAYLMLQQPEPGPATAVTLLRAMAGDGSGAASLALGELAARGLFVQADFDEAVRWWTKSASVEAYLRMAELYEGTYGYPERRDREKARESLELAASASTHLNADYLLGQYELRLGAPEAARAHFSQAAEEGNIQAMIVLGALMTEGRGGEVDIKGALGLFQQAADSGSLEGAFLTANLLLSINEENDSTIKAAYFYLLRAAREITDAQNELAMLYLGGKLGGSDFAAAVLWLQRAASAGNATAQNNLAALYESGTGVKQDLQKSFDLYSAATAQGNADAAHALGRFYASGLIGGKADLKRAWSLLKLAVELGDAKAQAPLTELEAGMDDELKEQAGLAYQDLRLNLGL